MKKLLVAMGLLVLAVFGSGVAEAKECGDCFSDVAPYVQVNHSPFIDWGEEDVNVCPGGNVSYSPGDPLYLTFGFWDKCEEYRGAPQRVCGEFFIVVASEDLKRFFFYANGWHYTTSIEEIKPYRVIRPEGERPFVWHAYFPDGVTVPSGKYYVIAFADKEADGKPTLSAGAYKYCFVEVTVP